MSVLCNAGAFPRFVIDLLANNFKVNGGINKELLESIQIPSSESSEIIFYNKLLVEKMIKLASSGCAYDSRVRLVTLEILIASLKLIVIRYSGENNVSQIIQ